MTVRPILERELRVRARQPLTFWLRGTFATLATLLALQQLSFADAYANPASSGRIVFHGLVVLTAIVGSFSFLAAADALSLERREQTLGLLLLTGIRPGDVLGGKLLSVWLTQATALLAFVPVLMLPVLGGGVRGDAAVLTALALGHLLFFSVALGLWASARHREWFKAVRLASLWMLLWGSVPWLAEQIFRTPDGFGVLSPWLTVVKAVNSHTTDCLLGIGTGQLIAWALLWQTKARLRRTGAETEISPQLPAPEPILAERGSLLLSAPSTFASRAPLLDHTPLRWLLRRQRGVTPMIWLATGITCLTQLGGLFFLPLLGGGIATVGLWYPLYAGGSVVSGAIVAWAASRFIYEARRSGELEVLLTTPMGAAQIVTAQWRHLQSQLIAPLMLLAGLNCLQYLRWFFAPLGQETPILFLATLIINSVATLALYLAAVCWAAMYFGARLRTQLLTVIAAVSVVKVGGLVVSTLANLIQVSLSPPPNQPYQLMLFFNVIYQLPYLMFLGALAWYFYRRLQTISLSDQQKLRSFWPSGAALAASWRKLRHWTPGT